MSDIVGFDQKRIDDFKKQEEEEVVSLLAEARYNIAYINLQITTIENEALRLVPEEDARHAQVAPFKVLGKVVHLGVRAPESGDTKVVEETLTNKGYSVIPYMVSQASLEKAWDRYKELSFSTESKSSSIDISGATLLSLSERIKSIHDVPATIEQLSKENPSHRVTQILEVILAGAISIGASDIHIEPEEEKVVLRYRLDGILEEIMTFPHEIFGQINSRLKLLSGLKLTMKSAAQDGRFAIFMNNNEISIRTSLIPGAYGESIVMRILDPRSIQVDIEDLGMTPALYKVVNEEIAKPFGLILLTGPTGSGKTTTLYAFLRRIKSSETKTITIEEPIEYHLEGITQTQVEKNYSFAEGLRAALRQDPDIIMVGEIRDAETATTAVQAAQTGHLVFSTLHTNSAGGVIPRLIDLGVNPKTLPSALRLSIAQRLVRKLCAHCGTTRLATPEETTLIDKVMTKARENKKDVSTVPLSGPYTVPQAVGCEKCNKTGYKGRIGIFEAIRMDEAIEKMLSTSMSEREITTAAIPQGILSIQEDAIVKVLAKVTSLEEVLGVVDFG